jgi:hypothetical protein
MWYSLTRAPQLCISLFTTIFILLWFAAWIFNAVKGTHFDLNSLRDMYIWLMTQLNATHAINSIWNSPKDRMPDTDPDSPEKKHS